MPNPNLDTGNLELIRNLIASDGDRVDFSVSLKFDGKRYEWRVKNWTRFLYDKEEDLYIPESVFLEILSSRLDQMPI